MRYPLTFYVDTLPPDVGGMANGPVIRILEKYRADEGIYRHELTHVKQWAVLFFAGVAAAAFQYIVNEDAVASLAALLLGVCAHGLSYRFVEPYRRYCEVEAYRAQAEYYPDDRRKLFAGYIAKYYNLRITAVEAERLLRS